MARSSLPSSAVLPFLVLSVSIILLGQGIFVAAVYWSCESDTECNSVVPTTYCNGFGYCECPAGRVFSQDVSTCLPESLYGESCQEGVQCSHMLTGAVCSSNLCTCREGLTYVQGRCRTLAPLFADCEVDVDCAFTFDRESVICKDTKCQCANGFYQRTENICRRILYNVGDVCSINADCQGLGAGHWCNNYRCALRATRDENNVIPQQQRTLGVQTSIDVPQVVAKNSIGVNTSIDIPDVPSRDDETSMFGDDCDRDGLECPGLPHSQCRRSKCHCQPGYYQRNGVCFAELGEKTDSSALCGTVYRDGKCVCTFDQFYMPNMRTCIKTVAQITDICSQESQCTPFGEAYCTPVSPRRCQCRDYALLDSEQMLCVKRVGLKQYCTQNEDCANVPNTECETTTNTCSCKAEYYEEDETCKPGVGGACNTNADCGIVQSECTEPEKVVELVQEEQSRVRRMVSRQRTIHEEIEDNEDEAMDVSEETSLLGGGNIELEGRRRRIKKQASVTIMEAAKSPSIASSSPLSPVSVARDDADGKTCKCKENYIQHEGSCVEVAQAYADTCEHTEQCQPLLGDLAECTEGKCVCQDEAHFSYGKCNRKVMLGDPCTRVSDCYVTENQDQVQCRNAQCQCSFTYTADVEQAKCLKVQSRNSSSRPSPLKVITLLLIAAAVTVTSAAIRDAVQRSQGHH